MLAVICLLPSLPVHCHLSSAICPLPSVLCHLLSVICHLLSVICYLLSVICSLVRCQAFNAVFGDQNRLLELSGKHPVFGDRRPVVVQYF